LEAGYFQLPFVVIYVTNFITYSIGKLLTNVQNIAMANILLNETVVPELIQNEAKAENIISTCNELLTNKEKLNAIKDKLKNIKERLGNALASKNAASIIYLSINET
jgi:lipid-A-disaccharide synthase